MGALCYRLPPQLKFRRAAEVPRSTFWPQSLWLNRQQACSLVKSMSCRVATLALQCCQGRSQLRVALMCILQLCAIHVVVVCQHAGCEAGSATLQGSRRPLTFVFFGPGDVPCSVQTATYVAHDISPPPQVACVRYQAPHFVIVASQTVRFQRRLQRWMGCGCWIDGPCLSALFCKSIINHLQVVCGHGCCGVAAVCYSSLMPPASIVGGGQHVGQLAPVGLLLAATLLACTRMSLLQVAESRSVA
jgi:hypothetical protein